MCQGRIYNSIEIKWDYLLLRAIVHDLPLLGVEGRMKTLELQQATRLTRGIMTSPASRTYH